MWKLLGVVLMVAVTTVWAEPEDAGAVRLPEEVITAPVSGGVVQNSVPEATLTGSRQTSVGTALLETPGVVGVRRSNDMIEPVIRGLGWERVQTLLDGLPLYGACPARMDPPVGYLGGEAVQRATLELALPSVTLGPVGTGGRVVVESGRLPKATEDLTLGGWLQSTWDDGRQGPQGSLGLEGATTWLSWQAGVQGTDYTDYQAADGTRVPADHESYGGHVSLELRPAAGHAWRHTYLYTHEEDIEYPSLPMDVDYSDFQAYTTSYRIEDADAFLALLELRFGVQQIDHLMSNTDRSNRAMMEASTPTTSTSYAGGIKAGFTLADSLRLTLGSDFSYLERDATRTRYMVSSGKTYKDAIWPGVTQQNNGFFGEINWQPVERFELRLGVRMDRVRSDADRTDASSLQNKTVREQYVNFYGVDAADVAVTEELYAANLLGTWHLTKAIDLWAGGGYSERPASVTERYFAFAPAPGGYLVGNPTLDPEEKLTLTAGVDWRQQWIDFSLSGYYYWMHNYILPVVLDHRDINMDSKPDTIYGYQNVDAVLYGGEASMTLKPDSHWSLPTSIAYVRGYNTTDNRELPEIPPLEVRSALRAEYGEAYPWWAQFGMRYAAEQNKVDDAYGENETAAFTVFHFRCGVNLRPSLRLEFGVENLFDEAYNEHLTREAAMDDGDLQAGDEIPAAERTWYASLRWTF